MKQDFYSSNLERPQNISSNFVTLFWRDYKKFK